MKRPKMALFTPKAFDPMLAPKQGPHSLSPYPHMSPQATMSLRPWIRAHVRISPWPQALPYITQKHSPKGLSIFGGHLIRCIIVPYYSRVRGTLTHMRDLRPAPCIPSAAFVLLSTLASALQNHCFIMCQRRQLTLLLVFIFFNFFNFLKNK